MRGSMGDPHVGRDRKEDVSPTCLYRKWGTRIPEWTEGGMTEWHSLCVGASRREARDSGGGQQIVSGSWVPVGAAYSTCMSTTMYSV